MCSKFWNWPHRLQLSTDMNTCEPNEMTRDEILRCELARQRAMCEADVQSLERVLHDDLIFIHSSGWIESKSAAMAEIEAGTRAYSAFEMSEPTWRALGPHAALLSGRMEIELQVTGTAKHLSVRFIAVRVRGESGAWEMLCWQSTHRASGSVVNPGARRSLPSS